MHFLQLRGRIKIFSKFRKPRCTYGMFVILSKLNVCNLNTILVTNTWITLHSITRQRFKGSIVNQACRLLDITPIVSLKQNCRKQDCRVQMQFQITLHLKSSMSDSQRFPLYSICSVHNKVDVIIFPLLEKFASHFYLKPHKK